MRRISTIGPLVVLLASLLSSEGASAYSKSLTPEEIRTAVEYGRTRRGSDIVDSASPYSADVGVAGAFPSGFMILHTPWLQIASVARRAAAQYRDPTEVEIRTAISEWGGKLQVGAFIAEQQERFWEGSHGVIIQGGQPIQPTRKDAWFDRVVSCRISPCVVGANFLLTFRDQAVDPNGQIEIVITLRGGYKEARAKFELSRLR